MPADWIPCSDRLPERGETAKYSDDYRVIVVMNSTWYRTSNDSVLRNVIAWRAGR